MESFKPKATPLFQQLIESTKTHVILLIIAALFVGQYIIRSEEPQRWVQKMTRSQGVSQTKSKFNNSSNEGLADSASEKADAATKNLDKEQLNSLRHQEISVSSAVEQPIQAGSGIANSETSGETNAPVFRIIYAEVPTEVVTKWVNESSNAGLYQNLPEYSAGILSDFKKKMDATVHVLKVSEKKLQSGQSDTNLSGTMGGENGQMIGLATTVEFKSYENAIVHGSVVVNRNHRLVRDNFPAEFDLPKNAAFFMRGAIRLGSFQNERMQLNMPPFQVFKSTDFITRKTEFVIIIEPEYK